MKRTLKLITLSIFICSANIGAEPRNIDFKDNKDTVSKAKFTKSLENTIRSKFKSGNKFELLPNTTSIPFVSQSLPVCVNVGPGTPLDKESLEKQLNSGSNVIFPHGWLSFAKGTAWGLKDKGVWLFDPDKGLHREMRHFDYTGVRLGDELYFCSEGGLFNGFKQLDLPIKKGYHEKAKFFQSGDDAILVVGNKPTRFYQLTEAGLKTHFKDVPTSTRVPSIILKLKDGSFLYFSSSGNGQLSNKISTPELQEKWDKLREILKQYKSVRPIAGMNFGTVLLRLQSREQYAPLRFRTVTKLALLDSSCELKIVECDDEIANAEISSAVVDGKLHLLFINKGFARLDGTKITWLEKSNYIKLMTDYMGRSKQGHDVFVQTIRYYPRYWIMKHKVENFNDLAIPENIRCPNSAGVDSKGRVWFIANALKSGTGDTANFPEPKPLVVDWQTSERPDLRSRDDILFRRDPDGTYHKLFSVGFNSVVPGRDGAVFLNGVHNIILLHENKAWYAKSVDELITKHFDRVHKCAIMPKDYVNSDGLSNSGIFAVEDRVIVIGKTVTVWKDGKPDPITKEIEAIEKAFLFPGIYGPLGDDDSFYFLKGRDNSKSSRWLSVKKDNPIKMMPLNLDIHVGEVWYDEKDKSCLFFGGYDRSYIFKGPNDITKYGNTYFAMYLKDGNDVVNDARFGDPFLIQSDKAGPSLLGLPKNPRIGHIGNRCLQLTPEGVEWVSLKKGAITQELLPACMPFPPERLLGKSGDSVVLQGKRIVYFVKPQVEKDENQ